VEGMMEMYFYYLLLFAVIMIFILLKNKVYPPIKLQVKGCKRNTYSSKNISRNKSTFPSFLMKGSVTLEATIVMPVFIFCIFSLYSFFYIINYQNIMQVSVNNTAKSIGKYAYVLERIENLEQKNGNINVENFDKDILISGINTVYVWKKVINDEVKKYTSVTNVQGGTKGINVLNSKLGVENGENDIIVSYKVGIDILGIKRVNYRLVNRCFFREWIGESIIDITDKIQQKVVYITSSGKVYHLYSNCTHINLSVSKVTFKDIGNMRNSNGGKYYNCDRCVKKTIDNEEIVYIASNGTSYHIDTNCSGIKRDVKEVDISNVGDKKLCSRCSQKYERGK
jgi:hypothetical protein